MPLDPMYVNPMLDPFRGMLRDVEQKGLTGPSVDEMRAHLRHMEELAQQTDDFATYSGRLAQEDVFQKFSNAYSAVLAEEAQPSNGDGQGGPSDDQLLANTLRAYEDSLRMYEAGQAGEDQKAMIPYLRRIVELGESGISYPVFLRILEEEGLTRVLEGAAPATRPGMVRAVELAQASWDRWEVEKAEQQLAAFDEMVARAPFGQPDPLALKLAQRRIEHDLEPLELRWSLEVDRWDQLLDLVIDWLDSFCSFAPRDERWVDPSRPHATRENIERTQQCNPGDFRFREGIYRWYFQEGFQDIWDDESFRFELTARRVVHSDERLLLARDTEPHCQPGATPPAELVQRAEALHPRRHRPDVGQLPPWGTPLRTLGGP